VIKEKIKNIISALSPSLYKKIMFKKYDNLNWANLNSSNAESEILLLKHLLDKDSVFFDVGSNIGAYLYMADKFTNSNNLYGFEPIPELYQKLEKTFDKVNISQLALSNEELVKQFKIPTIEGVMFMPRATLNTEYLEDGEKDSTFFDVQTKPLDAFMTEVNLSRLDLIKIDVEGHETKVIEGAKKSIQQFRPALIIEIEQRHHTTNLNDIIKSIVEMGYTCCYFDIVDFSFKKLEVDACSIQLKEHHKKSRKYVNNFVFLPDSMEPISKLKAINADIQNALTRSN
jgi:FkbM family methyltransferase